jgi:hypothetical protein
MSRNLVEQTYDLINDDINTNFITNLQKTFAIFD